MLNLCGIDRQHLWEDRRPFIIEEISDKVIKFEVRSDRGACIVMNNRYTLDMMYTEYDLNFRNKEPYRDNSHKSSNRK